MSRPGRIAVAVTVVVVAALVGVSAAVMLFARGDSICRGVAVGGISVAGFTRSHATRVLDGWWQRRLGQVVTLTALDSRKTLTLDEIGAQFDRKKAVDKAYAIGREGPLFHRAAMILSRKSPDKQISPTVTFSERRLNRAIRTVCRSVNKPHKDASLKVIGGKFVVEPEHLGTKVDEARARRVLRQALLNGNGLVPLPMDVDKPDVTTADVGQIDTLLSTYTTYFNPGKRDRTHNLRLAANSVSGVVLKPGQTFSYNGVVGPRLLNRGFRNAPIFVRGNVEPGLGGGCCQVSSTVYNAVLLAGLRVRERSHHSRTVAYVKPGRDATVAYGLLDFKFENTNPNPIGLIAVVKGSLLTMDIFGAPTDKKQVKILTRGLSYRPAGLKKVVDATLKPGARKVVDHGSRGASVTVYRKLIGLDGTGTTELVSRDRYPAQPKVVAQGPVRKAATLAADRAAKQPGAETGLDVPR